MDDLRRSVESRTLDKHQGVLMSKPYQAPELDQEELEALRYHPDRDVCIILDDE